LVVVIIAVRGKFRKEGGRGKGNGPGLSEIRAKRCGGGKYLEFGKKK